ncbi:MAG TPA: proline--tRNA ligase [Candidatus Nanoarchaeia archaeon]|nr:proline--tRNA ligase [Candidatus Nanoarchaeia archaeon]
MTEKAKGEESKEKQKERKKEEEKEGKNLGITVKKSEDFSEWYTQVVLRAELADYSPVKGCMILRPNGYALWESIQEYFNHRLKNLKVKNSYFPLFIPESFFAREAEHAKGFTPEVAWISNREEEKLAVRPTSETIIYDAYSRWIRSHRDLPLRLNQWCNVVRWETKSVKLFLRTREFLWQEGHCAYETSEEAEQETILILEEYKKLCEELLAVAVVAGKKTENEKFAGALYTTAIEAFMPDGKALQMGTSHNLGQGFGKSFGISFLGRDGNQHIPCQTSWGVSTRLIGGMVMIHSDDKGIVIPPKVAPVQVVVVPIIFESSKEAVLGECGKILRMLPEFRVHLDDRDGYTPGWKFNEWEMKGVPLRIEVGPRDAEKGQAVIVKRDTGEKSIVMLKDLHAKVKETLEKIQHDLFAKSKKRLDESIISAKRWDDFENSVGIKFIKTHHCGDSACETLIKEQTGATARCIPFDQILPKGKCIRCGRDSKYEVYFAKGY